MNSRFTKEQRNEIYKEALKYFINNKSEFIYKGLTVGMCFPIRLAIKGLFNIYYSYEDLEGNFPEFYAFKPKQTWKKNTDFWFTCNIKYGGYDKRVSILTALADGKTPEQWKKEWKALGKR